MLPYPGGGGLALMLYRAAILLLLGVEAQSACPSSPYLATSATTLNSAITSVLSSKCQGAIIELQPGTMYELGSNHYSISNSAISLSLTTVGVGGPPAVIGTLATQPLFSVSAGTLSIQGVRQSDTMPAR
jgi:hypothetical protein